MPVLVPLVAALVPLLITPGLLAYFDITPKIAILLLGVTLSLLYRNTNVHNIRALLGAPAGRYFASLLGAAWFATALSTAFSTHVQLSLHGGNWRRIGLVSETGLLLFVLLAAAWLVADDGGNLRTLLRACTASGAIGALYGIAQYFGWDPWLPSQAYQAGEGAFTIVRPPGTMGHADYFAAWMVVATFFGIALARLEPRGWRKIAAGSASMLTVIAVVLSGTRGAILALIAGAAMYLVVRRAKVRPTEVVLAVACAAGLAAFFYLPAGARLRARLEWSREDPLGGARLLLWRDSTRMALHRPLTGFGPETFATEFPRFQSVELARAYPDFYHESPHNMFLDALTEQGPLGLMMRLGMCALGIWTAVLASRSRHPLAAPLAGALTATLVAQQFVVFVFATSLYFYLVLAALASTMWGGPPGPQPTPSSASVLRDLPPDQEFPRGLARPPYKAWLFVPPALIVMFVLLAFTVHLVIADHALAVTQQRIANNDASGAAEAYRRVLQWQPHGAGADLDYSRRMQQLAVRTPIFATRLLARQQAIQAGVRATTTAEDRQNAWYNLALLLATQNDVAGVERCLRSTIASAPNWFKPHWTLAQFLERTNRHAEALREAQIAVELDGGHDPEVAATLNALQSNDRPR